ncbi:MAG TPA: helix-turn-helix domain-containing protein [Solirubrobacterales bacterium]|nr:helix-turn-helix domain-containing protein [Solirubrobacterales bacterium]
MSALGLEDKWVEKEWTLGERFGANVVWFRRQAGLTQTQLADRIGMNRTILSKLEGGGRLPRLDTILKLVAALKVKNRDLVAWMWWDPASHRHYEAPPSIADVSGYEVRDFHLPAGFRVSPVGYASEERFKDRLRQRGEDPDHRVVLELLRDDAPKVAPRERPDAVWVLLTAQALEALREERGLTRQELADRSPTTAAFIKEIEEGRCDDPGLRILEELSRALNGEGSVLAAQIEPVRAVRKAAIQKALDELAERDAGKTEEDGQ